MKKPDIERISRLLYMACFLLKFEPDKGNKKEHKAIIIVKENIDGLITDFDKISDIKNSPKWQQVKKILDNE